MESEVSILVFFGWDDSISSFDLWDGKNLCLSLIGEGAIGYSLLIFVLVRYIWTVDQEGIR